MISEAPISTACRICGNDAGNTPYRVREMLYGTRETFDYFQCAVCGCLQIMQIPEDLVRHYSDDYFPKPDHEAGSRGSGFIERHQAQQALGKFDPIGWVVNSFGSPPDYVEWMRHAGLDTDARILDVGCRTGKDLLRMHRGGFAHCTGIDPFIRETISYPNGVTIHKTNLDAFSASAGPFDLIMFHHALEHMSDPLRALQTAARVLSGKGCVLANIPVADSHAWEEYRENWAHLDAPRHLHLLTRASLGMLAKKSGLSIAHERSIATPAQFTESERYKRDIPGNAPTHTPDILTRRERTEFRRRTEELNREGKGDRVMFWLWHGNTG